MVIAVEAHRLAYAAVPKAGCTTVKMMLAQIDPDCDWAPAGDGDTAAIHGVYRTSRFRPRHWRPYRKAYRFTVVRDPLSRLLAVYSNRVLEYGDLKRSMRMKRGRADLPMEPDPDFFFQHLAEYCAVSSSIQHHTRPTATYTGRRLGRYSKVYRTGELGLLARDLAEISGQAIALPHANRSGTRLSLGDLSASTRAALREKLDFEYRFLADYFDNPFA